MSIISLILLCMIPGLIGYPIIISIYGKSETNSAQPKIVKHLVYIVRAIFFACIWPLLGILLIINKIAERNQAMNNAVNEMKKYISRKPRPKLNDGKLTYWTMGGMGIFYCKVCNFSQGIISFLHGFGEDAWTKSGYQCQECGKFHKIECEHKLDTIPNCECGGILSRENPLFCPVCKSFSVGYQFMAIT